MKCRTDPRTEWPLTKFLPRTARHGYYEYFWVLKNMRGHFFSCLMAMVLCGNLNLKNALLFISSFQLYTTQEGPQWNPMRSCPSVDIKLRNPPITSRDATICVSSEGTQYVITAVNETNAPRKVLWQRVGKFLLKSTITLLTHLLRDMYYEQLLSTSPFDQRWLTLMQFGLIRWIIDFE